MKPWILPLFFLSLAAASLQAAPKKKATAKKPSKNPVRQPASPAPGGPLMIVEPLSQVSGRWTPTGALVTKGGPITWLRNCRYERGTGPLFPPGPLLLLSGGAHWSPAPGKPLPDANLIRATGETTLESAQWLTAVSGPRTLTLPVGTQDDYPPVQLTPQISGNVVWLNQDLPLGVTLTNLGAAPRNWRVEYRAASASGSSLASGSMPVTVPAHSRLTVPVNVGPISLSGSVTVSVTARDGSETVGTATTGGGAVPVVAAVKSSEFPFGLRGGDLRLAQMAGVQAWMGGWPWFETGGTTPLAGTKGDAALGSAEGVFRQSDTLNISLISRAYTGQTDRQVQYDRNAMDAFNRRSGGWAVPYTADYTPDSYMRLLDQVYGVSKAIHKDALTFAEFPAATDVDLETGRGISAAGGDTATDLLAVDGLGVAVSSPAFPTTLDGLLHLRDTAFPARPIWNIGEELSSGSQSPIQQAGQVVRSTVEQITGGVDKVFWNADSLLRTDGTAAPGFFGLAALSKALAGSEYVGSMPWPAPARGEVFQKNGTAILVAWSVGPLPQQIPLPLSSPASPDAYDPMFTRSTLVSLSGRRLSVRAVPVFVTGLGKNLLKEARGSGWAKRREALSASLETMGHGQNLESLDELTPEKAVGLFTGALDAYSAGSPRRAYALTAVDRLLRLWDLDALTRASADTRTNATSVNHSLDLANRAQADLRAAIEHREGPSRFQPDSRFLLTLIEKRLWLARQALRQKDFALAKAHAEEMTAAAQALIPYVKVFPVSR